MDIRRLSTLCLLLATAIPQTNSLAQDVTYDYATRIPTGAVTTGVFVSDLDADSRLDLLYIRRGTGVNIGDIGVLMGNGDGSFGPRQTFQLGVRPFRGALGDVNNDGRPDLLVQNQTQLGLGNYRLTVVLGNGDGTFDLANAEVYPAAAFPSSVALDDINNDNQLDILYRTSNSNVLDVLTGNGDGTFDTSAAIPLGNQVTRFTSADLNNDNRTDLIVIDNRNAPTFVKILLATPGGAFAAGPSIALPGSGSLLSTARLNGDAFLDLVVSDSRGDILIGLGNGDGTFDNLVPYAVTGDPTSIVARDIDGSGTVDLVVRHGNSDSQFDAVLSGNGDGTFGDAQFFSLGQVQSVQVDDLDNDGRNELIAIDFPNEEIIIVAGNDRGTFGQSFYYPASEAPRYPAVADVNLDGDQDVVVVGKQADVFLGNGDGSMQHFFNTGGGRQPQGLTLADFNNDGKFDMASPTQVSNALTLRLGAGNGTFGPATSFIGSTEFPLGIDLAVGDVDNQRGLDIAVANRALEHVSVARNNGSASFTSVTNYGGIGEPTAVALGDIDGDTVLDLAVGTRVFAPSGLVSNIYVLEGRGDGTFKAPVVVSDGLHVRRLKIVDFDNSGDADLVLSTTGGDEVAILLQNRDGTFDPAIRIPVGRGPQDVDIADLNRDGRLDVVTANAFDETISLVLQNANGSFTERVLPSGQRSDSLAIKDINGDGTPDLAVVTFFAGGFASGNKHEALSIVLGNIAPEISSIFSNPSTVFPGRVNFTVFATDRENDDLSAYWDFDGDGKADRRTASLSTNFVYPESGTFDVGVRVVDDRGSSAAAMTTVDVVVPEITPPEPPTDLFARGKSGVVNLSWTPSPDSDTYNFYRGTVAGGPYALIAGQHMSASAIFVDNDVTDGVTYYYVVRATLNGVESADSNEAQATPGSRGRGR